MDRSSRKFLCATIKMISLKLLHCMRRSFVQASALSNKGQFTNTILLSFNGNFILFRFSYNKPISTKFWSCSGGRVVVPRTKFYRDRIAGECIYIGLLSDNSANKFLFSTDTWCNDNVIVTSERRRFDVAMTLSLRRVSTEGQLEMLVRKPSQMDLRSI